MDKGAWWAAVHGVTKSRTHGALMHTTSFWSLLGILGPPWLAAHSSLAPVFTWLSPLCLSLCSYKIGLGPPLIQ